MVWMVWVVCRVCRVCRAWVVCLVWVMWVVWVVCGRASSKGTGARAFEISAINSRVPMFKI